MKNSLPKEKSSKIKRVTKITSLLFFIFFTVSMFCQNCHIEGPLSYSQDVKACTALDGMAASAFNPPLPVPNFSLKCPSGASGFLYENSFDIPESKSDDGCWQYSHVQRVGNLDGVLNLFQSFGSNISVTTPFFYMIPSNNIEIKLDVFRDSESLFKVDYYLENNLGVRTFMGSLDINSTHSSDTVKPYFATITAPSIGTYRIYFDFIPNPTIGSGDQNRIDWIGINAPINGTGCSGDANFSTTVTGLLDFFPVGSTPVTYTATYNDSEGVAIETKTCSYNVEVNKLTLSGIQTNASCNNSNGSIQINTSSANASTNTLNFTIDGNDVTPLGITLSKATTTTVNNGIITTTTYTNVIGTIIGLSAGLHTINANDSVTGCSTTTSITVLNAPDTQKPILIAGSKQYVNLGSDCKIIVPDVKGYATDDCTVSITQNPAAGTVLVLGYDETMYVTVTATDGAGNIDNKSVALTAKDITPPTIISASSNTTINCPARPKFIAPTATDNCGNVTINIVSDITTIGSCAGTYSRTITWDATDSANNHSNKVSQTITVEDKNPPIIKTQAANMTVECDGYGNQNAIANWLSNNGGAVAMDNCSGVTWSNDFNALSNNCSSEVTVIFTAKDKCNNIATTSATFSVQDTTAPDIPIAPENITVTCTSNIPASETLSTNDNCNGLMTVLGVDNVTPGNCPNSFTVTRTWTFTDACSNFTPISQIITVEDKIVPTFTAPANIEIFTLADCTYNASVEFTGDVTNEADNCSTGLNATFSDSMVAGTCEGSQTITRTWSLVDECGNKAEDQIQTIIVFDKIAPTFTAPANTEIFTNASCTYDISVEFTGDVTDEADNCSTGLNATFSDSMVARTCEGFQTITRTWSLIDECGNKAEDQIQTITVSDKIAPTFTAPANIEIFTSANCTYDASVEFTGDVTNETDNCSTGLNATFSDSMVVGTCEGFQTITRTWSLVDECGNKAEDQIQTIIVFDKIAPTFTAPANTEIFTNASCTYDISVEFTGDVTDEADNCSTGLNATFSDSMVAGTCEGFQTITRTWSLVDECGNKAEDQIQIITVSDKIAPTFTAPANIEIFTSASCTYDISVKFTGDVTNEADNCSTGLNATFSDSMVAGTCEGFQTITRTWSLVDECGNKAENQIQTIIVFDNTPPIIKSCAINQTIKAGSNCQAEVPDFTNIVITDNCSSNEFITITQSPAAGTLVQSGTTTIIVTATDTCGNTTNCEAQLIITNFIVANNDTGNTINGNSGGITYTNVLSNDSLNCEKTTTETVNIKFVSSTNPGISLDGTNVVVAPGTAAGSYSLEYKIYEITNSDNYAQAVVTITVEQPNLKISAQSINKRTIKCDDNSLIIKFLENITRDGSLVTLDMVNLSLTSDTDPNITLDNLGNLNLKNGLPVGSHLFEITVCDKLNPDNCTPPTLITINVEDNTVPVFKPLADKTISCGDEVVFDDAKASDNCGSVRLSSSISERINGNREGYYSYIKTWTATDNSNNTVTTSQTIYVEDHFGPTLKTKIQTDFEVNCDAFPEIPKLDLIDNCSSVSTKVDYKQEISDQTPTSYKVVRTWLAYDTCGNSSEFIQEFKVNIINNVTIAPQTINVCNADSTPIDLASVLPKGSPLNGTWINKNNIEQLDTSIFNVLDIPVGDYTFEYRIPDDGDCATSIQVNMKVNNNCKVLSCESIFVHNAFSPNSDSINDVLVIDGVEDEACYPSGVSVEIYNRWGVLVFETSKYNNTSNAFEGYSKGRTTTKDSTGLPTGTYFFILNYDSIDGIGNIQNYKKDGFIYLSR